MPDNFCDGVIDAYCCEVNSVQRGYRFTVRPKVYILYENQQGSISHDEAKMFRTWITASGLDTRALQSSSRLPSIEHENGGTNRHAIETSV